MRYDITPPLRSDALNVVIKRAVANSNVVGGFIEEELAAGACSPSLPDTHWMIAEQIARIVAHFLGVSPHPPTGDSWAGYRCLERKTKETPIIMVMLVLMGRLGVAHH
jgi:hypothetical protein